MSSVITIITNKKNQNNLFSFLDLVAFEEFRDDIFEIPIFQRKYVWTSEIIEDFLGEVKKEFENRFLNKRTNDFPIDSEKNNLQWNKNFVGDDIFFGTIYWANQKHKNIIIDGHQRILTWFLILLSSFRIINNIVIKSDSIVNDKNNDYEYKDTLENLHRLMRSWLFKNSNKNSFKNEKVNLHFQDFVLKDRQKDDEETFKRLFSLIFSSENKESQEFTKLQEVKNFIKTVKKENKERKNNLNIEILEAYVKIEDFILKRIEESKQEKVIENHAFLSENKNDIFSNDDHFKFTIISWLIFKTFTKFKFAIFKLSSVDKASQIFETINGKGLQLTIFDVIKNNLYNYTINNNLEFNSHETAEKISKQKSFENSIIQIEKKIQSCYGSLKKSDSFLLDFLKSSYCHILGETKFLDIKKKNLHSKFKEIANNSKDKKNSLLIFSDDFLKKALEFLEKYEELFINISIQNMKWKNIILSLNLLKYDSIKIILICMLIENQKKLNNKREFEKIIYLYIEKLYKYYLLNLTVSNQRANTFENHFKRIIYIVKKYGLENFFNFIKINREDITDENIRTLFEFHSDINRYFEKENINIIIKDVIKRDYRESEIIKWYLYNVTRNIYGDDNSTLDFFTLEHVMPKDHKLWQKGDFYWKSKEKVDFEDCKYKLGNCLLLLKGDNVGVSNKLFEDKYGILKEKKLIYLGKDNDIFMDYSFLKIGEHKKSWSDNVIFKRNEILEKKLSEFNIFYFQE